MTTKRNKRSRRGKSAASVESTSQSPDTRPGHPSPAESSSINAEARRGDVDYELALPWLMAAIGGASVGGAWRLWGFPDAASASAEGGGLGIPGFMTGGAAAALAISILWFRLGKTAFGFSGSTLRRSIGWAAVPLLFSWIPAGGVLPHGRIWTVHWMILLAGLGGALGAYHLNRAQTDEREPRLSVVYGTLLVAMLIAGMGYGITTILGFRNLENCSYTDFGGFHNAAWNTLHGRFMYSDHWDWGRSGMIWQDHLTVFLLIPTLLLWLHDRAETFLVLQSFAFAAAAMPIFLIARRESGRRGFALALALAFLLSPFAGRVVMYEFHVLSFAMLTMAWLLWACRGAAPGWLFLMLGALALSVREDMALPVAMVGLWEATFGRRPLRGSILITLAIAWAVLSINFFMPSAREGRWIWESGGGGHLDRYTHLGGSYGAMLKTLATQPVTSAGLLFTKEKLPNFALLLLPLFFLPLLSPERLWIAAPVFLLHALSNWPFQNQLDCQYAAPIIPVMFFAAAGGARRLAGWMSPPAALDRADPRPPSEEESERAEREEKPSPAEDAPHRPAWPWRVIVAGMMGAAVTAHLFTARWRPGLPAPLSPYDGRRHLAIAGLPWRPALWRMSDHAKVFQQLRAILPPEAGVAVPDACAPHLTSRPLVRAVRRVAAKSKSALDFIVLSGKIPMFMKQQDLQDLIDELNGNPQWEIIFSYQDFVIFGRSERVPERTLRELERLKDQYTRRRGVRS